MLFLLWGHRWRIDRILVVETENWGLRRAAPRAVPWAAAPVGLRLQFIVGFALDGEGAVNPRRLLRQHGYERITHRMAIGVYVCPSCASYTAQPPVLFVDMIEVGPERAATS